MTEQIFTGAVPHVESPLDYKTKEVAFASSPFDWNKGYDVEQELGYEIPTKDQGSSGSCGGQGWGYYGGVLMALLLGLGYDEKSAKFIYAQTSVKGGGSDGRTNSDLVCKKGWGSESMTPSYQNGNAPTEDFMERPQDISAQAFAEALKSLGLSYSVGFTDMDSVAQYARDFHGCIIGITGSNNGTWWNEFPVAYKTGETPWFHWLYVGKAKMINGKKYIGVKNSWGDKVGVKGWQWLGEEHFTGKNIYTGNNVWVVWNMTAKKPVQDIPHTFSTPLTWGVTNQEVSFLQAKLQKLGFFPKNVNCTGYFGDITARSLKAWQVANGIMDFANETDMKKIRFGAKSIAKINTQ